ncbi:MAG TPA: glycosyltransferase family 2 protein [Thermoanaerobaculia bacterium]|nr:glycosyltransferase family 2 protein [Thermoanaerobaculia bacterium]
MSPPRLSVVIPTRDTQALTLACLASLTRARHPPLEVVVVDDGSSDGTAAAVAAAYPEARVLRHPASRGFTAAANAGLAAAGGELLWLLNSDTEVDPGAPESLDAAFARDPRLGVAGAALRYPDGEPQWSGGASPTLVWLFALASGLARALTAIPGWRRLRAPSGSTGGEVEWVSAAALAMRRQVWERVGPLDERFALYCQDLDLCLRARRAGWRVAVVADCEVVHHHGATVAATLGAAADRHQRRLLWQDLVRWLGAWRGPAAARRGARALRWGGALRRLGLALALPWGGAAKRQRLRRELADLAAAESALRRPEAFASVPET